MLEARLLLTGDTPGDDLSTAQVLSLTPNTATALEEYIGDGVYGYGDVDLFKVSLTAGQTLGVDVDAQYLDNGTWYGYLNSHLRIFNSSGFELANNGNGLSGNDFMSAMYDSYLSFTATTAGDYYVGVSGSGNEYYDPNMPGMGYGYYTGNYVLQLLVTGGGGGGNQAPVASNDSYSVNQNTTLTVAAAGVLANDTDANGNAITASVQSQPSHGTLNYLNTNGSFGYVPANGFTGSDSFTYVANDGTSNSNVATVTITVNAVASDPGDSLTSAQVVTLASGVTSELQATIGDGSFPSGDVDLFKVSLTAGQTLGVDVDAQYLDNGTSFSSLDSRLRIFNSSGLELASNGNGLSANDYASVFFDSYLTFTAAASGDYYVGVSSAGNSNYDPTFPGSGMNSTSGSYVLQLLFAGSSGSANQAPVASVDSYVVTKNGKLTVAAAGILANDSDPDGDAIAALLQSGPANGTLSYLTPDGAFEYIPDNGFVGADSFSYVADDGTDSSAAAAVSLDVRAPIKVTTHLDSSAYGTSLRDAVSQANLAPGPDVIAFDLDVDHRTITLSAGALVVSSDIQVEGPTDGTALTILGTNDRVLAIDAGRTVRISDLTIANGNLTSGDGAGIRNAGVLTLERVTVANSFAQGGDGGAIFNATGGLIILLSGTMSGNEAFGSGGGIHNEGSITILGATVADNSSSVGGAGIHNEGVVSLGNTIVASNTGAADLGGVFSSLGHNLIGNLSGASGFANGALGDRVGGSSGSPIIDPLLGPLQDHGGASWTHPLLPESPAIDAGDDVMAAATDQRFAPRILDGLDPNDSSDSLATVDIGAFEFGAFFVNTPYDAIDLTSRGDGLVDADLAANGSQVSLRGAVLELNALAGWHNDAGTIPGVFDAVILFDPTADETLLTIRGASENDALTGDLDVYGSLTIRGRATTASWIDAAGIGYPTVPYTTNELRDRAFHVSADAKLRLEAITVAGGHAYDNGSVDSGIGGAVLNDGGSLEIFGANIGFFTTGPGEPYQLNKADVAGGGIYSRNGTVTLSNGAVVDGNRAVQGGGIYIESGSFMIEGQSVIRDNLASLHGGGIYLESGELTISGASQVVTNGLWAADLVEGAGKGIYIEGGTAWIREQSAIIKNFRFESGIEMHAQGGGIYNESVLFIEDSEVSANGSIDVVGNATVGNTDGGGIYNAGSLTITNSQIDGNQTGAAYGGGIFNTETGHVRAFGGSISENFILLDPHRGAGIYNDGGVVELDGTRLENQFATRGGAIYNDNGDVTLTNVVVKGNDGWGSGGGIYNYDLDARLTIIDSTFESNESNFGGAVFNSHGTVHVQSSTFLENTSIFAGLASEGGAGGGILHLGTNRLISSAAAGIVTLAASVNSDQDVIFVTDTSPLSRLPLPTGILVGDERMTLTAIDEFKQALQVERANGTSHSVSSEVRTYINETQTHIVVGDPAEFSRFELPLDIVLTSEVAQGPDVLLAVGEVMTVTAMDGDVLTVERGRNGTTAIEHPNPSRVYGVGGSLTISNSSFFGNHVEYEGVTSIPHRGGALFNFVQPFVRPTIIENSTFLGNTAQRGSGIWTAFNAKRIPEVASGWWTYVSGDRPFLAYPNWSVDSRNSIFIQNSVIAEGRSPDGTEAEDILVASGTIASGGSNFVGAAQVVKMPLDFPISATETVFGVDAPEEGFPPTPFVIQVRHISAKDHSRELQVVREGMLVTAVKIEGHIAKLTVIRGQAGTLSIEHPAGSSVTVSTSGFWDASDRFGAILDVGVQFVTRTAGIGGISSTQTRLHVADASNLPSAPFMITASVETENVTTMEAMLVTDVHGTELTVQRGYAGTSAVGFATYADIEFDYPLSARLDPGLAAPRDAGGTALTAVPTPGSPLLEAGSKAGFEGTTTRTVTHLDDHYSFETELYMSVTAQGAFTVLDSLVFADDTFLHVVDAAILPIAPFLIRVEEELMEVTSVDSSLNKLAVQRGVHGTEVNEHSGGNRVIHGSPITASATQTTFNVRDSSVLPLAPFVIRAGKELMRVTAVHTEDNAITVERGSFGSRRTTHDPRASATSGYFGREFSALMLGRPTDIYTTLTNLVSGGAESPLAVAVTAYAEDTIVFVADTSSFPPLPFAARFKNEEELLPEIVWVTGVDPLTDALTVVRGAFDTEPAAHAANNELLVAVDSLAVAKADKMPRDPLNMPQFSFMIRVENELLDATAVDAEVNGVLVQRGKYGTTPVPHALGAIVWHGYSLATAPSVTREELRHLVATDAESQLEVAITADLDDIIVSVADTSSFPPLPFAARFTNDGNLLPEIVWVTKVDPVANAFTVTRGAFRTHPAAYAANDYSLVAVDALAAKDVDRLVMIHIDDALGLPNAPFSVRLGGESVRVVWIDEANNNLLLERDSQPHVGIYPGGTLMDPGVFLQVDDASDMPASPIGAMMGDELVRVTTIDRHENLVTVERGAVSSDLSQQNVGVTFVYGEIDGVHGYHSLGMILAAPIENAAQVQVDVVLQSDFLVSAPFHIRIDQEEMAVNAATPNSDGSVTLTVTRGVNGTTPSHGFVAGSNVFVLTDQRGVSRYIDSNGDGQPVIDIGATDAIMFQVNSLSDTPDLTPGNGVVDTGVPGAITLRAAIIEANALRRSSTIFVPAGVYSQLGDLDITGDITIIGESAATTTIVGSTDRVFEVHPGADLELVGLYVTGGNATGDGGGVLVDHGTLRVTSTLVANNAATNGAGVANHGGSVTIVSSTISENDAGVDGGAVANFGGQVTIANSTLSTNTAASRGGAILSDAEGSLTLSSSTLTLNVAHESGGLHNDGITQIGNSIVADNVAQVGQPDAYGRYASLGFNLVGVRPAAATLLAGAIGQSELTNSQITFTVASATNLPSTPFAVFVGGSEEMLVNQVNGNELTALRAQAGTNAGVHATGATVRLDGFWQTGDQAGTLSAPIDPYLGPLNSNSSSTPMHEPDSFLSPAINNGDEQTFSGQETALALAVRSEDRQIFVTDWKSLPPTPYLIQVRGEVMRVVQAHGAKLTVVRRVNGTGSGVQYSRGDAVSILTDQRGAGRPSANDGQPAAPGKAIDIGAFESAPRLSIAALNASQDETSADTSGSMAYTFRITRSGKTTEVTPVNYYVLGSGDHPANANDFVGNVLHSGTLLFAPYEESKDLVIYVSADEIVEHNETFQVVLAKATYDALITESRAESEIRNDDSTSLSIDDVTAVEGMGLVFTATLNGTVEGGFTLPWATSDGSASLSDADYFAASDELLFQGLAGESHQFVVHTAHDSTVELHETLQVTIGAIPAPAPVASITVPLPGSGTLTNDDYTTIAVGAVRMTEGDDGTKAFAVDVTLSPNPVDIGFTVMAATSDGTASAGQDYSSVTSVLNFNGDTAQHVTLSVPVTGDTLAEADELLSVGLSNALAGGREAYISLTGNTVTILTDEGPRLVVSDVTQLELASGLSTFSFDVVLLNPLGGPISVDVSTVDGTAVGGGDFIVNSQTLNFSGFDGETLAFDVQVRGGRLVELNEAFEVRLSNLVADGNESAYTLQDGVGTIANDDVATLKITAAERQPCADHQISPCQFFDEGDGQFVFEAVLFSDVDVPFTVVATVVGETAENAEDFAAPSRVLNFTGHRKQVVQVPVSIIDDDVIEPDQTFVVTLSYLDAAGRAVVIGSAALGQIVNDDFLVPEVTVACIPRPEGTGTNDGGSNGDIIADSNGDGIDDALLFPSQQLTHSVTLNQGWWYPWMYMLALEQHGWPADLNVPVDPMDLSYLSIDGNGDLRDIWGQNFSKGFTIDGNGLTFTTYTSSQYPFGWYDVSYSQYGWNEGPFLFSQVDITSEGFDLPPPNVYCAAEPVEDDVVEAFLPAEVTPLHVDWTVPHTGSLTFNPFPTFNYRLAQDVGVTIQNDVGGFARIGETVDLEFGAVTVNADMTLTYDPYDNLMESGALRPEIDANGNVFRYTGIENFEAHIVDYGLVAPVTVPLGEGSGPASLPITYASVPVELAVSNHLPSLRGDRIHSPDPTADAFFLDSPIFLDLDTTLRVDLTELFVDLDGDTDLGKLRIKDINYGGQKLDMTDPTATPPVVDRYPKQIRVPIATTTSGITVPDPATGNPIVQFGGEPNEPSLIAMPSGSAIDFHNTIWPGQIATLNNANYPSLLFFTVSVTDGTKQPKLDANGDPELDVYGDIILEEITWDVMIDVRPNPDSSEPYDSPWREKTSAPQVDFRPWLAEVTPQLDPLADDGAPRASTGFSITTSQPSVYGYNSESIGGVDVDLFAGEFRRYHDLILDGSGGTSELAIPGLVYDSSVIHIDASEIAAGGTVAMPVIQAVVSVDGPVVADSISATLTWHNKTGTVTDTWTNTSPDPFLDEYVISLSPPEIDPYTGVYGWELTVNITSGGETITLTHGGETPVIIGDETAIFGAGWSLEGVPWMWVDTRNDTDDASAIRRTYDDRIVLGFPGQVPQIFNAMELTLNDYSFAGELHGLQPGSTEVSYDGFANPQEFGTLTSRQNPDELVYDDGSGQEYVFKKYDFNGQVTYLVDRIEQPGISFDTTTNAWPAGRRGVSFEWSTSGDYPVLAAIVASDGGRTEFAYDTIPVDDDGDGTPDRNEYYIDTLQSVEAGSTLRLVDFTVNADRELTEIRHRATAGANSSEDRIRRFSDQIIDPAGTVIEDYDGRMAMDQWFNGSGDLVRHTQFHYDNGTGTLSRIQFGDGDGVLEHTVAYDILPASTVGLSGVSVEPDALVAQVRIAADYDKYDEATDTAIDASGTNIIEHQFTINGSRLRREELFKPSTPVGCAPGDPCDPDPISLSVESWDYDHIGLVKRYTDPIGQQSFYWRDYEEPIEFANRADDPNDLNADDEPRYDHDDYRGNVTYVFTPSGHSINEYETDDETHAALGTLVRTKNFPKINASGNAIPGGTASEIVTKYGRRNDGRLESKRTIRDSEDPATLPINFPVAEQDYVERWTYGSNGYVASHTDARGLLTEYPVYNASRAEVVGITDDYDGQSTTVTTAYDPLGYPNTVTTTDVGAGAIVSIIDYDYDSNGFLLQTQTKDGSGTVLTRVQTEFAPDGIATASIDGNDVRTDWKYDKAGLLTESVQAVGEAYFALYAGLSVSNEQRTIYDYYADGTIKQTNLPGGLTKSEFVDAAAQIRWTVTDGVSDGEHSVSPSGIVFDLDGVQVVKTDIDNAGVEQLTQNLLTSDVVTENFDSLHAGPKTVTRQVGPPNNQLTTTSKLNSLGKLEYQQSGTQKFSISYGTLYEAARADLNTGVTTDFRTSPAGDVIEQIEHRQGNGTTAHFTTTFEYDERGRRRKTVDPLTDGDSTHQDETGASPARTDYAFDLSLGLMKTTSTSRAGIVTYQWTDATGRLAREENELGGVTTYKYDLAGNLIEQNFIPAAGDPSPARLTTIEYDQLGRLRATITHGSQPSFSATDYFATGDAGSDGWNLISFIPLPGTSPVAYSDPNVKNLATRTRTDSLGNTYYIQYPDPDDDPDNTPTTLITYSYLTELGENVTTTRLSVAENVGVAPPSISTTYGDIRVDREVTNALGQTILVAQRLGQFANPDSVTATVAAPNGYDHLIDSGFTILSRNEYYPQTGQLKKTIDGRDNATDYTYTPAGQVATITRADGSVTSFEYDSAGNLTKEIDPRGNATRHVSDALNRNVLSRNAFNELWETQFAGNTTTSVDSLGGIAQRTYDPASGHSQSLDAISGITQFNFGSDGKTIGQQDQLGNLQAFDYDDQNRFVGLHDAAAGTTSYVYDEAGNLVEVVDPLSRSNKFRYNRLNQATEFEDPAGEVTSYMYNASGNVTEQKDALGNATQYVFDGLGRTVQIIDALGGILQYVYDAVGNVIEETNARGYTTEHFYDNVNRLIETIDPLSGSTQYAYDLAGNLISVTDPLNRITTYVYDVLNRLTDTIDPLGGTTSTTYDAFGNVLTETDALGRVTSHSYDALGRRTQTIDPVSGIWQYTYDAAGNLTQESDPLLRLTDHTYDALNRRVSTTNMLGGVATTTYDLVGNVTADTDELGNSTTYVYDVLDRLVSTTDKAGANTSFVYDAVGNLLEEIDPFGEGTTYDYDALNRRIRMTDRLNGISDYFYDAVGNLTREVDPLGRPTDHQYDALNRRTEMLDALSNSTNFTYDAVGNIRFVTDALLRVTEHTYDALNRNQQIIDAAGGVFDYSYDAVGNVRFETDQLGRVTETIYDGLNRKKEIIDANGQSTIFMYDSAGNLIDVDDAAGYLTQYSYDSLNRRIQMLDAESNLTNYYYDAVGNLTSVQDPLNRVTSFTYDGMGRQLTQTDPSTNTTTTTYDAVGNVLSVVDPLNHAVTYTYDKLYRLETATDALTGQTAYTYDAVGNRTSLTDSVGNATTWTYDDLNRVIEEKNAANDSRLFVYDEVSNLVERTDRNGRGIQYDYDALNRRTAEHWIGAGARTITTTYDLASQVTSVTDPDATISYTYDLLGRATTINDQNATLLQAFDPLGNRTRLTVQVGGADAFINDYTHDMVSRLTTLKQSGGSAADKRVDFSYDDAGQYTNIARHADLAATQLVVDAIYTFDASSRLTNLAYNDPLGSPLADYAWTYDAADRVTQFISLTDGTATYTYDVTNQLTDATYDYQTDESQTYDANGNRTSAGYATTTNNITTTDGAHDYQYDAEGNRTQRSPVGTGEMTEYEWDHRNRLVKIIEKDATGAITKEVEYTYDPLNRRIAKSIDEDGDGTADEQSVFVLDGDRASREGAGDQVVLQLDGSGNITHRYVQGPDIDQILADENELGEVLWPLADNLGSIRDLATHDASTGDTTVANHITYDAFGNVTNETNAAIDHIFGFTGRERDEESHLQYNRARYYDAAIAQWVGEDPLGFQAGDTNLRRYVGNNATGATDPSGREYIKVKGNTVYWVVEHDGWTNRDVAEHAIGTINDGVVLLNESYGGGRVMLSKLKTQASRYWNDYADMSGAKRGVQQSNITNAIAKLKVGNGPSKTDSAAAYILKETGSGAKTGAKAVANSAADTVVSTVTLGSVDNVELITVTDEDRARGYDLAYAAGRAGSEILVGVATGGAAASFAKGGKVAQGVSYAMRAHDVASNLVEAGRIASDVAENGLTVTNVIGAVGSTLAIKGDLSDGIGTLSKTKRAAGAAEALGDAVPNRATSNACDGTCRIDVDANGPRVAAPGDGTCFIAGTQVLIEEQTDFIPQSHVAIVASATAEWDTGWLTTAAIGLVGAAAGMHMLLQSRQKEQRRSYAAAIDALMTDLDLVVPGPHPKRAFGIS